MAPIEAENASPSTSNGGADRDGGDDKPSESVKLSPSPPLDLKHPGRGFELPVVNNVFYNEETLKYMKIIDMYKRLGIGKDIELPRLVIAGAQACGKSSLLENLTGLPVPITTGIGTRFPIEITLIEDPKRSQTKPSIILDPKARNLSSMDKEKVQNFNLSQVYHDPMTQTEFENLLRQASDILGVPPPVFAGEQASGLKTVEASSQISSHVLQIEMRGKDFKSLSFVDTPGLYHAGSAEQDTTPIDEIEKLVTSLIAEKRTLIVAVMDATQPTVGQKIFTFAEDVDTTGDRTIGVLTKCDVVPTWDLDAFKATLRRAKNEERRLTHGWYVVKNRSSSETKANVSLDAARDKESSLFRGNEWRPSSSGIQSDRMGIMSLRTGLSNVFCAHIRAEFPAFNRQTRMILKQKRAQIVDFGPARSTAIEQRVYLKSIVDAYQIPKTRCLTEDYRTSPVTEQAALALERILATKKKTNLRDSLKNRGAVWVFQTPTGDRDDWSDKAASAPFVEGTTKNIYTWINHRYQETKSCTMPGLVPYALVERLFEEQTVEWQTITNDFVDAVTEVFSSAATYCLRAACTNSLVCAALEHLVCAEIIVKMQSFRASCYSLIRSERKGMQVIACEQQFVKDIREARTLRFISALAKLEQESFFEKSTPSLEKASSTVPGANSIFSSAKSTPGAGFGQSTSSGTLPGFVLPPANTTSIFGTSTASATSTSESTTPKTSSLFPNLTGPKLEANQTTFKTVTEFAKTNRARLNQVLTDDRQLVYEMHDILKAYYAISVQSYTDMVCKNQLDDTFIVDTMNVFSNDFVNRLSDSEISAIAAENPADRKRRRELKEDIERLELAISESEAILNKPLTMD